MKLRGEMFMDKMKDSGIKWIGDSPIDWNKFTIGQLFEQVKQKNTGLIEKNLLSLSYGRIKRKDINSGNGLLPESFEGYNIIEKNDIVLRMTDLQNDKTSLRQGIAEERGIITAAYITMRAIHKVSPRFVYYQLYGFDISKGYYGMGSGVRQGVNWKDIKKLSLILPNLELQNEIAKFLDERTALIDEIISDSKKSIEELKAYKQSLITEIVTKGLDPNVTLVPSGIDWIGDIPEGWEVVRSKNILSYSKGLSITKENLTETGIPVINYGQIHSKYPVYFNPRINQLPFVSNVYLESKKNALLNQGDFVFADTSEDISGSGNFSSLTSDGIVFAGYHTIIARIIDKTRINFRYLAYYFSSELHRKQVGSRVSGVKVFSISQKILKSMLILLPNRDEQNSIANYLDQKTAQIDTIIAEKENLIFEFESYKKSMIYEYVTGKKQVEGYES